MLGNLKAPPEPFGDIIRTHFRLKAASLEKQLDDWVATDDGKLLNGSNAGEYHVGATPAAPPAASSSAGIKKDAQELKDLLRVLTLKAGRSDAIEVDS